MNNAPGSNLSFSSYVNDGRVREMIVKTLGSQSGASRLISSLISAVSTSTQLTQCDPKDILYAAFYGETLGLYPLPQLGHYYIVPYYDVKTKRYRAAFQLGYKGMVQLAIKTNSYVYLNCTPIKEGELLSWNGITEELQTAFTVNLDKRSNLETIGFAGGFKLTNGFTKTVYWTKKQVYEHASKFSKSYASNVSPFWKDNFDAMGRKTVLRALLLNWGILSPVLSTILADFDTKKVIEEEDITPITAEGNEQKGDPEVLGNNNIEEGKE